MAFDVYVGTMTRFYRRDWENVAQRMAREQGLDYQMIYVGGKPAPPPPADEIRQAVAAWCAAMSKALEPHGFGPLTWNEEDDQPYFTERPAWDGYSALLVWAAHAEHRDLPLPIASPQSWVDDPAYRRSTAHEFDSRFRTILLPELWLPVEFPFIFEAPTLVSEKKSYIGSVFNLKRQLDDLHTQTNKQLRELRAARATAPPLQKPGIFARLFSRQAKPPDPPPPGFADMADFGLEIFRILAGKACEHRLPMLLHF